MSGGASSTFDRVLAGEWEGATDEDERAAVRDVITVASVASAALAVQPIPLVDLAILAPIHVGMVRAIGAIHGYRLDAKAVLEMLSSLGASLLARAAVLSAVRLVPFVGWAVAVPMAYATTWSIGEVADHYFRTGRGVGPEGMRELFERCYREKKAEKERGESTSASLRDKLRQLVDARAAGLIDEAEFQRKKEELLRDL
ncbi:DUF697 domain-containing protein [Sandaracinus amylolyticus]|uniref:DUF697 domain-containing protein n=1 Tax=Sandaracinus amylolyticus TaxID=927083 RepID=UPI001F1FFF0D|nr:DUF697 domain-containing protein [Sandaracinus amylolyticus]UJR82677.1 Hypothetical protein I5071_47420 [Sandaracinus amylolyticus]